MFLVSNMSFSPYGIPSSSENVDSLFSFLLLSDSDACSNALSRVIRAKAFTESSVISICFRNFLVSSTDDISFFSNNVESSETVRSCKLLSIKLFPNSCSDFISFGNYVFFIQVKDFMFFHNPFPVYHYRFNIMILPHMYPVRYYIRLWCQMRL